MRYSQFRRMMYRFIVICIGSIVVYLTFYQGRSGHHKDQNDASTPRQPVPIPFVDSVNLDRPDKRVYLTFLGSQE